MTTKATKRRMAATAGLYLSTPWLYLSLAPLFSTWDGVSMLGMSRLKGFVEGCAILYLAWRLVRGLRHGTSWLREAAAAIASTYPAEDVALYLTTLVWQDYETWGALADAPKSRIAAVKEKE